MNHRSRPPWYTWNPHELLLQHRAEMTSKYTPVHAQHTNPHTNTQRKRMSMTSRSSVVRSVLIDHQQQVLIAQAPLIFFCNAALTDFNLGRRVQITLGLYCFNQLVVSMGGAKRVSSIDSINAITAGVCYSGSAYQEWSTCNLLTSFMSCSV